MNRNYISSDLIPFRINDHYGFAYRVTLNKSDLQLLYSYLVSRCLCVGTGILFTHLDLLVQDDYMEDFKDILKHLRIIIYEEKDLERMLSYEKEKQKRESNKSKEGK